MNDTNYTEKDPNRKSDHESSVTILFLFISCGIGALVNEVLKKTTLPYTVAVFLLGVLIGTLSYNYEYLEDFTSMSQMHPLIILNIFLPILIFESAYSMNSHVLIRSLLPILILAVLGLLMCTSLIAFFAKTALALYEWDWLTCFLFGSILSATDPVAVVALFRQCGISESLTTLVEGESLMNDGAAIVTFTILLDLVSKNRTYSTLDVIKVLIKTVFGAPLFGYVMGKISTMCLLLVYKDSVVEFTVTLCFTYLTYNLAESVHISGVLSVLVLGVMINIHRSNFSPETEHTVHCFWEMLSYFANTLIFIIVGINIPELAYKFITLEDVGLAFCTYMFITAARFVMVLVFSPFLTRTGYGLTWKESVALIWGGLRGAVGMALSHIVVKDPDIDDATIAGKIMIQLSMCIFLTLLINGLTMQLLLRILGMNEITRSHKIAMGNAIMCLREVAEQSKKVQMSDKNLAGANWLWVDSKTWIENPYRTDQEFSRKCAYSPIQEITCSECYNAIPIEPTAEDRLEMEEEARVRFLSALKSLYWDYFEHSTITRPTVGILLDSCNEALDHVSQFTNVEKVKRHMAVPRVIHCLEGALSRFSKKMKFEEVKKSELRLNALLKQAKGLRETCLRIMMNLWFDVVVLIIILINVFTIIIESFIEKWPIMKTFELFIINVIITVLYVVEAVVKLIALGCKGYFREHWNKYTFFVLIICLIDLSIALSLEYQHYIKTYYLSLMSCVVLPRLVEMLKVWKRLCVASLIFMKDTAASEMYHAYDLGVAIVTAHEEILEKIDFANAYKPCGTRPSMEAENCILLIMTHLNKIQNRTPEIAVALKSHKAALLIWNDVIESMKQLELSGLIDEHEYIALMKVCDESILKIMRTPKTLKPLSDIMGCLESIEWIQDEDLRRRILANHDVKEYKENTTIHKIGDLTDAITVITSGIVKIYGKVQLDVDGVLPNSDGIVNFHNKERFYDFLGPGQCLGVIGYSNRKGFASNTKCETPVKTIKIKYSVLDDYEQARALDVPPTSPSLLYLLWKNIAVKVAFPILRHNVAFENFKTQTLRLKLEKAFLPDLSQATSLKIDEKVSAVILVQGRCEDAHSDVAYIGPELISQLTKEITFDVNINLRCSVIILLLAEDNFVLPEELDWSGVDSAVGRESCLYHAVQERKKTLGRMKFKTETRGFFGPAKIEDSRLFHEE